MRLLVWSVRGVQSRFRAVSGILPVLVGVQRRAGLMAGTSRAAAVRFRLNGRRGRRALGSDMPHTKRCDGAKNAGGLGRPVVAGTALRSYRLA